MIRNLFSRTTCRHPSVCPATPGPDQLMCPAHAFDEPLAPNAGDRLAPWNLDRPGNERPVPGWLTARKATRNG